MTGRPYFLGVALIAIAVFWFAFQGAVRVEQNGSKEYRDQLATALSFDTSVTFMFERPIEVADIVSADTIRLINGEYVRYAGVDAPEAGKCYAREAFAQNSALVRGQYVTVYQNGAEKTEDGEWRGDVYLKDGVFVNDELVRSGSARATGDKLKVDEAVARELKLGLWGACTR